jgi:hypothetical protein
VACFLFFVLIMIPRNFYVQAFRDSPTNKVRARMSVASAIIFGSVFWRMGKSDIHTRQDGTASGRMLWLFYVSSS